MKKLEQKSEELVSKFRPNQNMLAIGGTDSDKRAYQKSIKNAIQSLNYTVEVLERIKATDFYAGKELHMPTQIELDEQLELKKILESKI